MWERNLGITAEFQQTEFATFLKDLHKGRFQMFDIGWIADYPDPGEFPGHPLPQREFQQPHSLQ